jgi:predicted porin
MNKKLIALAIAGAFAAPVAMADDSNVVIYGVMAASVEPFVMGGGYTTATAGVGTGLPTGNTTAGATSQERRWRVSSNNTYLGFKGTEDLGNGMSAIWVYEQSIAIDQQSSADSAGSQVASNQSHRQIFVGLNNKRLGAVTLGLQESPMKTSTGPLDVFGQHTIADYRNIWGSVGGVFIPGGTAAAAPTSGGANIASIRAQNSVMYTSPNMGGFTIKALAGAQNENGNNTATTTVNNPRYYSANTTYANGPIFATVAYEDNKVVASDANNISYKNWRTGFGYSFAGFKVGLAYERIKGSGNGNATGGSQELRRSAWYLPVSYQFGSNTIKVAFTHAGKSNQKLSGTDLSGSDGAKQVAVGFDHAMSKRTNIYALYTQVRNDNNGSYAIGSGGSGIAGVLPASYGADPKAMSVGIIHKF